MMQITLFSTHYFLPRPPPFACLMSECFLWIRKVVSYMMWLCTLCYQIVELPFPVASRLLRIDCLEKRDLLCWRWKDHRGQIDSSIFLTTFAHEWWPWVNLVRVTPIRDWCGDFFFPSRCVPSRLRISRHTRGKAEPFPSFSRFPLPSDLFLICANSVCWSTERNRRVTVFFLSVDSFTWLFKPESKQVNHSWRVNFRHAQSNGRVLAWCGFLRTGQRNVGILFGLSLE